MDPQSATARRDAGAGSETDRRRADRKPAPAGDAIPIDPQSVGRRIASNPHAFPSESHRGPNRDGRRRSRRDGRTHGPRDAPTTHSPVDAPPPARSLQDVARFARPAPIAGFGR